LSQSTIIHLGRWGLLALILATWQWGWNLKPTLGWLVPTVLDPYFVSKPSIIFNRFLELSCLSLPKGGWAFADWSGFTACVASPKGSLWTHTLATLRNTFWGFLVGVTSGVAVGLLLGRSETLAKIAFWSHRRAMIRVVDSRLGPSHPHRKVVSKMDKSSGHSLKHVVGNNNGSQ
jgi:ABC-type nitrate/sulfonate/bicarbonate transport system permease component